jgi:hypothetical protein
MLNGMARPKGFEPLTPRFVVYGFMVLLLSMYFYSFLQNSIKLIYNNGIMKNKQKIDFSSYL